MRKSFSKRYPLSAGLLIAAAVFSGCASKQVTGERKPWAAYQYNEARANQTPEKLTLPLVVSWDKDISPFKIFNEYPKEQLSSPIVANGAVYTGSTDEKFYSIDAAKGNVKWKFDAKYPLEAPPTVSGDRVCFGSSDGILRCFDNKTGKELWHFQARSEILSSPLVKDGLLYFSSSDDKLYALSLDKGEKVWAYSRSTYQTVAPRIYGSSALSGDKLYHFFSDGYIVCLSAETGKELWSRKVVKNFDSPLQTRRTPLVDDGLVYVIDDNNAIEALSTDTGEVKGIYNIIKAYDFIVPDRRSLVIAGSDQVVSIDRLTGSILWKREFGFSPMSTVFAADDLLFILSNYKTAPFGIKFFEKSKGYIQALRLKDGEPVWGQKLKSTVTANGSVSESRVAVLTNQGVLEIFETK